MQEPTYKIGNCLDQLLTDVPSMVDLLINPPLGNSNHCSTSFSVKMGLKNWNILLSCKVYLKSRVDWPCVVDDLFNHNWSVVY